MALSLVELQAKRDRLLKSLGIERQQDGDQAITFAGDKAKELAMLDAEIERVTAAAASTQRVRQTRMSGSSGL